MPLKDSRLPIQLDTLLLLLLLSAHLWFNPASNALVVVGTAVYVALDLLAASALGRRLSERLLFTVRLVIVFFIIMVAAILPTGFNILQRQATGPAQFAHDGLIQTEIAIQYLLEGKNPYVEDYVDTPMADFPGLEPPLTDAPLYHNAYLPFLFIVSIPFHLLFYAWWGWYDQRLLYMLAYFGTILLLPLLVLRPRDKLALIIAVGLNFLFVYYLADGRNDIMILFGLVLTTVLLSKGHISSSALVLGLTMATKHQAWFFGPFYLLYLLPQRPQRQDIIRLVRQLWPLAAALLVVLLPFILWDAAAFVDDTITYVSGSGAGSFPMKGWGFSTLLLTVGILTDPEAAFPFTLFQLAFGLPVLLLVLRRQWQQNNIQNMWAGYAIFAFVFQFFSRFFNDNYFIFIIQIFIIAVFMLPVSYRQPDKEQL